MPISPDTSTNLTPDPRQPRRSWIGEKVGKYVIKEQLGQGGMGVVFRAYDPLIDRDVAIKLLAEHLVDDEQSLQRFLAEARAVGKLNHPNVCAIHEIGQEGRLYYLVMEYIDGGSLGDLIERIGPLSPLEATRWMIDACRGIEAAHRNALIHRDIKPANLMLSSQKSVKVMDFGLAKAVGQGGGQITQTGVVLGTPFYMSPEQCSGEPVDARTDIYSLGATFYSLLTGRRPYQEADSIPQIMFKHCHAEVPDPRTNCPTIPAACADIVQKAMAKSRADRYQSVSAMLLDLEAVAATLSGQRPITLPSQSGTQLKPVASATAPSARLSHWHKALVGGMFGLGAFALIALGALFATRSDSKFGERRVLPLVGGEDEPVKIGILHSFSGTMAASESVLVDAINFGIEQVNKQGGVLGRPVKAVYFDGRSDADTFAKGAEKLITEDNVSTLFGCWTSASRKEVKRVVEERNHLLVYPLQYEGLETSPNIIYMGAAPNQQILPAVEWAVKTLHKRRFYLVGSDYVFPHCANEIIKDYLKTAGGEVVGESYLPLGSLNVSPIVKAIKDAHPDMIINTINGDSNTPFFRALREAKIPASEVPVLSFSVGEQELKSLDPKEVEGDYSAWTYFQSLDTPENKEFVEKFHERYPQRSVTDPMASAYAGVILWAEAVNDAKSLDPKKIRREMLQQRMVGPQGEIRIDPDTQHCYLTPHIGEVDVDGKFTIVWSGDGPIEPEPYPPSRTAADWLAYLRDLYTGWGNSWSKK